MCVCICVYVCDCVFPCVCLGAYVFKATDLISPYGASFHKSNNNKVANRATLTFIAVYAIIQNIDIFSSFALKHPLFLFEPIAYFIKL